MSRIGRSTVVGMAIVLLVLLASCQQRELPAASQAAKLRISGTDPAVRLLKVLASEYGDNSVEFVFLPGHHSTGAIEGVSSGGLDIGAVGRDLFEDEQSLGLRHTVLCNDAVVLAANPSCGITKLTTEQVRDIYTGRCTRWSELGGADLPIVVLDRNEDESAKVAMRKHVFGASLEVTASAGVFTHESDMVEAVAATPGAIGYSSLGAATAVGNRVHVLELDGVRPTVANVHAGKYRVVRPLGAVIRRDAPEPVTRFVEWAAGPEGRAVMERHGYAAAQ
ncbi:MAG: substrate-binding domain-containing protein [Anaerosomatales bacterium]|nr:substrate-binding domain-containing protein [Anaerosomatales bacterium]